MKAHIPKNNRTPEFFAMSLDKSEGGGSVNFPMALWEDKESNESLLYTYAGFSQVANQDGVFQADFPSTAPSIQLKEEELEQSLLVLLEKGYVISLEEENTYQFTPYRPAIIRK